MRVSLGTARLLNLVDTKVETLPTLAYLMYGERCRRNCKFCSQSSSSTASSLLLSRVTWPDYDLDVVLNALAKARNNGDITRCCVQVVDSGAKHELEHELAEKIRVLKEIGLSICLCKNLEDLDETRRYIKLGVDIISMPIDAANAALHRRIKGGSFAERLKLLKEAAQEFPGQVGTHIIVGMGETEEETLNLMTELVRHRIQVGLFAFTPIQGTQMAHLSQPDEGTYRRIQIARFLISNHGYVADDFEIRDAKVVRIKKDNAIVIRLLCDGKAFETSGCSDCNRPYYNERPRGTMYNYPRPLTAEEIYDALLKSSLFTQDVINSVLGNLQSAEGVKHG
jgi:biotin synthase-related radical SAM superfamily protein